MAKIRVYQVAQELGITSKEFIQRAQALGYSHIQSHANTLEPSEASELRKHIKLGHGAKKPKRPTILRRRATRSSGSSLEGTNEEYQVTITRLSEGNEKVIESKKIELSLAALPTEDDAPAIETVEATENASTRENSPEVVEASESVATQESAQEVSQEPVLAVTQEPAQKAAEEVEVKSESKEQAEIVSSKPAKTADKIKPKQEKLSASSKSQESKPAGAKQSSKDSMAKKGSDSALAQPQVQATKKEVTLSSNKQESPSTQANSATSTHPAEKKAASEATTASKTTAKAVSASQAKTAEALPTQPVKEKVEETPAQAPKSKKTAGSVEEKPKNSIAPTPQKKSPKKPRTSSDFQRAKVIYRPSAKSTHARVIAPPPPSGITPGEYKLRRSNNESFDPRSQNRPPSQNDPNGKKTYRKPDKKAGIQRYDDKGKAKRKTTGTGAGAGAGASELQRPNRRSRRPSKHDRRHQRGRRRKNKNALPSTKPRAEHKRVVKVDEAISVAELSHSMGIKGTEIIRFLLNQGKMTTINQSLSVEEAKEIAQNFGYEVQNISFEETEFIQSENKKEEEDPSTQKSRPPVVTVMGHVDHGKTSLLDAIRQTKVADGEAGGITQHIGASVVNQEGRGNIVFLDTPGHEAFTAMRLRGARSTDIVILVVAADDGVMPQTIEAISHAKASGAPIIVAINKCDKAGADPQKVRYELMNYELVPEELGGDVQMVDVSAHTRQGIDDLLDGVLLQAEIMELAANPEAKAGGVVIEARQEKGRGPVATVLVQEGTLKVGDAVVVGSFHGKIRAMFDHQNNPTEQATPSIPVRILGLSGLPDPGEAFHVATSDRDAKKVAEHRGKQDITSGSRLESDPWDSMKRKELGIILKTDVHGSLEALKDSLKKMAHDEVEVVIRHSMVGGITENDVNLAISADAVVIGFQVRADGKASRLAESEGVSIRTYRVIYELLDDIKAMMQKQLAPTLQEKPMGQIEIRKVFTIPKAGKIAGCYVLDGKVSRNALMRLFRENIQIYEGKVASLRRFKQDAKEVAAGYECGLQIEGYQDLREGDIIEAYEIEEIETKME